MRILEVHETPANKYSKHYALGEIGPEKKRVSLIHFLQDPDGGPDRVRIRFQKDDSWITYPQNALAIHEGPYD